VLKILLCVLQTCLVDQERFMQISYNLRKLTLTSSVLLVALSAPADRLSSHTQFRVSTFDY